MKRVSTLLYIVNDFEKCKENIIDLDSLFNVDNQEFTDVFEKLDAMLVEPRKEIVSKILDFAKSFEM